MVATGINHEFVDREYESLSADLKRMGDKLEAPPEFRTTMQTTDDRRAVGTPTVTNRPIHLV